MRGIVVPSSPCCPSTSAAAFKSLRVDSLLRACCGSSFFLAIGFLLELGKIMLDIDVNVNLHLHLRDSAGPGVPAAAGFASHLSGDFFMASATVTNASVPAGVISASTVEHPLRNPRYRLWLIGGTISL